MRLVLVHGINNEKQSAAEIGESWMGALSEAWATAGLSQPEDLDVCVPYYAEELAALSRAPVGAVQAGGGKTTVSGTEMALLQEYADAIGVTGADVLAAAQEAGVEIRALQAGVPHVSWVIGLSRALEGILPSKGKYLARLFLRQAAIYLDRAGVQSRIKNIVRPHLFNGAGPSVIVAHSLGTVISYELLTEKATAPNSVPLFCTLGSPLAVSIVADHVGKRSQFPNPPIQRWLNGYHANDFVTLGRSLEAAVLGFGGIENENSIVNDGEDKHDILAYLGTPGIAAAIHGALCAP